MVNSSSAFDELADQFSGVLTRGRMMGRPILSHGRRMVACWDEDGLAFRLGRDEPAYAAATAIPGAVPFAPGGRPFRDWVLLPTLAATTWAEFILDAVEFGSSDDTTG